MILIKFIYTITLYSRPPTSSVTVDTGIILVNLAVILYIVPAPAGTVQKAVLFTITEKPRQHHRAFSCTIVRPFVRPAIRKIQLSTQNSGIILCPVIVAHRPYLSIFDHFHCSIVIFRTSKSYFNT